MHLRNPVCSLNQNSPHVVAVIDIYLQTHDSYAHYESLHIHIYTGI